MLWVTLPFVMLAIGAGIELYIKIGARSETRKRVRTMEAAMLCNGHDTYLNLRGPIEVECRKCFAYACILPDGDNAVIPMFSNGALEPCAGNQ